MAAAASFAASRSSAWFDLFVSSMKTFRANPIATIEKKLDVHAAHA